MSAQSHLEIEQKFAVDFTAELPELSPTTGLSGESTREQHQLAAVYYDTADLRLTRAKITLRRRTGGNDSGWHLKLPATEVPGARLEIHAPLDTAPSVPAELLSRIRHLIRSQALIPIAEINNQRTEVTYQNPAGAATLQLCDDHVTARSLLPAGRETRWREWELELVTGEDPAATAILEAAAATLRAAGAFPADSPSKLATALGESINHAPLPPALQPSTVTPGTPAAAVFQALRAARDKLLHYDPLVRADAPDSIHQMRVATRQLRSHLKAFRGLVTDTDVAHLEEELKSLAAVLGVARDAEVVEERWKALVASTAPEILSPTIRDHLLHDMGREYRRAHRRVIGALNSERYLDLLEQLDLFLLNPPHQPAAAESTQSSPSHPNLDRLLSQDYKTLVKRHNKAVDNWKNTELTLHEREEYFHDMRKAVKKLRYSTAATGKATRLKTKALHKACKDIQTVLGAFQDAVTSRDKLLELANAAHHRSEETFGYGVLYQREQETALAALNEYRDCFAAIAAAFQRLQKKK